ncbi:MAG TPA: hypothetical protein VF915_04950 [Reyranella sp.]
MQAFSSGVIKTLPSARLVRVAGMAAGAVCIAAGTVWITASAAGYNFSLPGASRPSSEASTVALTEKSTRASAVCNDFVSHLAANLNTSQSNFDAAFQKAIGQTLDDEVKNGDLTRSQADAIKQRLAGKSSCALIAAGGLSKAPGANIGAYKDALLSAAASALGITTDQLKADLAKGMTLKQIAAAQKPPVTEAQFRSRLIQNLTPVLDRAVANGQLTKTQEQAIIQKLQTGPIPYWDRPARKGTAAGTKG